MGETEEEDERDYKRHNAFHALLEMPYENCQCEVKCPKDTYIRWIEIESSVHRGKEGPYPKCIVNPVIEKFTEHLLTEFKRKEKKYDLSPPD